MRVIHIATLFSPKGSFGGPTAVAQAQAHALCNMGVEVLIVGVGEDFAGGLPEQLGGVSSKLFHGKKIFGRGFAGVFSFPLIMWLFRHLRATDVVHIHFARDLVCIPAAIIVSIKKIPMVLQTHGMVIPHRRFIVRVFDAGLTRPLLRRAHRVLCLSEIERRQLLELGAASERTRIQVNGIALTCKAKSESQPLEVLFAARLHPRKGTRLFVAMAQHLLATGLDARFTLIGPDEGDGEYVSSMVKKIGDPRLSWLGPMEPSRVLNRMSAAAIVVLPSVAEPFGMTILEAMMLETPVIISDDAVLAPLISEKKAGLSVSRNVDDLAEAVASLLLDGAMRIAMGTSGREVAQELFSIEAVADRLRLDYESARSVATNSRSESIS